MYPIYYSARNKDRAPRKRQLKPIRTLPVSSVSGYNSDYTPAIRLNGKWLEDYGFHQGNNVAVHCKDGNSSSKD